MTNPGYFPVHGPIRAWCLDDVNFIPVWTGHSLSELLVSSRLS